MTLDRTHLPLAPPRFSGAVGQTYADSTPGDLELGRVPENAPNVVIIMLDDVGFGQTSTFGGPVNTPCLQRLAGQGLTYNRFHTTALCSPTRAALLSGRNHHSVHTGNIMELATGYPGYDGQWPHDAASIAEILKLNGYNTAAFGKWHNTPDYETSPAGPFDHWPTGKGFEHWWGFLGGEADQWNTPLWENTIPVERPTDGADGWHFTEELARQSIAWMSRQQASAPNKPFFMYWAPGAAHAPHHVATEWSDRYRGAFDGGWDRLRETTFENQKQLGIIPADTELTPRPDEIPAWDD
ncbi:MAG: sulfatase-like hydrolase/transferase, partial [Desertimonas sp.]